MGATISTSLKIFDSFSSVLNNFNNGLHQAITNANRLHQVMQTPMNARLTGNNITPPHAPPPAVNIARNNIPNPHTSPRTASGTQSLRGMFQQMVSLNQQMVAISSKQQQMAVQQNNITRSVQSTRSEAGGLADTLRGVVATYLSVQAVHKAVDFMNWGDEIAGANARLSLMNDGTQTQLELQQKVMAVANNTRQAYAETAKMVAQLGASTQGVFKSNEEVLAFTSRFNKLLVTGGANAEESKSAILQMTQALSSGVLQGDELRSLSETAPMLMKVLADGLGVARGSLKQMGADGKLTSDKIVEAFAKQDAYINQLFSKMPLTFGQAMTLGKNKAAEWVATINGTNGPLQKLTQSLMGLMSSKQGEGFMNGVTAGVRLAADSVAWFVGLVSNHMGIVKNILIGVGIVLAALAAQWIMVWISAAWPVLAVIAGIALFITMLNKLGVSTQTIVGVVAGYFGLLFAYIWNKVAWIWNMVLSFAEFLINVFTDPVYAVKKLFYDLAKDFMGRLYNMIRGAEDFSSSFAKTMIESINGVLKGFDWLSKRIKELTGVDLGEVKLFDAENVHAVSDSLKTMMDLIEKPTTDKDVADLSKYKMQEKNMGEAFNSSMEYGKGLFATMSNAMGSMKEKGDAWSTIDKVNEVGKIKDKVDISSEDLKIMRELAEMKNIQNFVTLQPSYNFGDTHVRNESDIETLVAKLDDYFQKDIASSANAAFG